MGLQGRAVYVHTRSIPGQLASCNVLAKVNLVLLVLRDFFNNYPKNIYLVHYLNLVCVDGYGLIRVFF